MSDPVAPALPTAPAKAPIVQVKPQTTAAPAVAAPAADLHEITVSGEKRRLPLAEIIKLAQKADYAGGLSRQAKEALAATKKAEAERAEREAIWDDDEKLEAELERRGKLDKLSRRRLEKRLAEQEMTPEQKRYEEKNAEAEGFRKEAEALKEEKRIQQLNANAKRIATKMQDQLADAAQRAGMTLPDAENFSAIAEVVKEFRDLGLLRPEGLTDADAEHICATAKANIEAGQKRMDDRVRSGLKGQALHDYLGKDIINEIRRHDVELYRGGGAKKAAPAAPAIAPATKPSEYLTVDQAREQMRKAAGK